MRCSGCAVDSHTMFWSSYWIPHRSLQLNSTSVLQSTLNDDSVYVHDSIQQEVHLLRMQDSTRGIRQAGRLIIFMISTIMNNELFTTFISRDFIWTHDSPSWFYSSWLYIQWTLTLIASRTTTRTIRSTWILIFNICVFLAASSAVCCIISSSLSLFPLFCIFSLNVMVTNMSWKSRLLDSEAPP